MPKKLNTLQVKQNMCDSSKFSDFGRPFINNTTTSAAQKYSLNVNTYSDLEINQSNQIHDDLNEIDLLRLNNKFNKISAFAEGIKENKQLQNVQCVIESNLSEPTKRKICHILSEVSSLSAPEKLFLYLRLPPESSECDPLRQPQNPLGSRSEINDTITWVRSHLKHDPKVSIPKQDVYSDYTAYCDRLDIKPLSTADFGKVMKQVFPEIKPRRLGTRGHSRYCYAAMRKATRLSPPNLPKMKSDVNSPYIVDEINNDSWQIIKMWSEEILNSNFQSLTELATFISKHNLNSQADNSTKALYQKKKLQREIKSKRKFPETISTKKRRKKKTKTPYSECFQKFKTSTELDEDDKLQIDKMQINKYQTECDQKPDRLDTQSVPINLTSDDKTYQFPSECAKNIDSTICGNITRTLNKSPEYKKFASNVPFIDIKEEFEEEYSSNILCKKVRQAQQSKGLWVPPMEPTLLNSQHYTPNTNYSMGPPAQIQAQNLTSFNSNLNEVAAHRKSYNQDTSTVVSKNLMQLSAKKQRCLQTKSESQLNDGENVDDDKNVLPENLGLPRERVISICNMDKHELDDYLIGENSQDQEAELLQYFQTDDVNGNENDLAEKINMVSGEDAIEIVQLRHYLHQNFQNNRNLSNQAEQRLQSQQMNQYTLPYATSSASASLAIMSQLSNRPEHTDVEKSFKLGQRRKLNLNSRSALISNNPNTKRKNFSFVPISLSGNISSDNNQFISPKSKHAVEKLGFYKQKSQKSSVGFNMSDPMIGAIQSIDNVASASAPPSPSVSQQKFQSQHIQNSFTLSNSFTQNVNNIPDCNYNEMVEYRSRSVPLHINTSPEFNKNESLTGLLSNSVTPTPIPTEFNDFNEPLIDFFAESNIQPPNQIEVSSLLDINIPFSNKNNENKNKYINIEKSECLNSSRSNPCTPLPNNIPLNNSRIDIFSNLKQNESTKMFDTKMFDTSKSVPSTPCVFTGSQFRYSPVINRDCLLSGNSNEHNLGCYQRQQLTDIDMNNSISTLESANTEEIGIGGTSTRTMDSTTYN